MNSHVFTFWIAGLTFTSGFLNGFSLLTFSLAASHHTGNIVGTAGALLRGEPGAFFAAAAVILSFFAGGFVSGLIFHRQKFELKKRYGLFLMSFSIIFMLLFLIPPLQSFQLHITACILGMQNGLFIFYDGIIIRTTHLTGYITDAATALAAAFHGNKKRGRLCVFYLANVFCFFLGCLAASGVPQRFFLQAASFLYLAAGLFYFIMRKKYSVLHPVYQK